MSIDRRAFLALSAGALIACTGQRAAARDMVVHKSPTCGCCGVWVDHMRAAGFQVTVQDTQELDAVALRLGVPDAARGCHTGEIGGYFVEGHVPAADVIRLLDERPNALGVAVAGMPIGSPGMEMGDRREPFDTLLVARDGSTSLYARHGRA
jgi:hypothetical protein